MPHRKCGDQYQDLLPVANHVDGAKGQYKKNMVISMDIQDMFQSQP
jgi:hypothetical protein